MGCISSSSTVANTTAPPQPPPAANGAGGSATDNSSEPPKKDGETQLNFRPIHSAFRWNKPPAEVEQLLTSPEAVNCVDKDNGNRPIHIASQNGHDDLLKLLIKKKAEINAKNFKGNTGLHMAIGYDYYHTAQLLIAAGASLDVENDAGVPARYGLEGDKCLGIALLCHAKSPEDVAEAFDLCEQDMEHVNKINFAQSGLKAKKALGDAWTPALQDRFKSITVRLN